VSLEIEGPGIECGTIRVLTREGQPRPESDPVPMESFYGATFEHVARAGRLVRGVVRDEVTGAPLAGVRVAAMGMMGQEVTTNREGWYELPGVAKRQNLHLSA